MWRALVPSCRYCNIIDSICQHILYKQNVSKTASFCILTANIQTSGDLKAPNSQATGRSMCFVIRTHTEPYIFPNCQTFGDLAELFVCVLIRRKAVKQAGKNQEIV